MFEISRHIPFGRHGVSIRRHPLLDLASNKLPYQKTETEDYFDKLKNNLKVGDRIKAINADGNTIVGRVYSITMENQANRPIVKVKNSLNSKIEEIIASTIEELFENHRPKTFAEFLLQ